MKSSRGWYPVTIGLKSKDNLTWNATLLSSGSTIYDFFWKNRCNSKSI